MIERLNPAELLRNRFIRYLAVGGLNTVFGYAVFALLVYTGLAYQWAVLCSTILGVLFNFFTVSRLVFKSKKNALIAKFVVSYGLVYGANVLLIGFLLDRGLTAYTSQLLCVPLIVTVSYSFNRFFVFQ